MVPQNNLEVLLFHHFDYFLFFQRNSTFHSYPGRFIKDLFATSGNDQVFMFEMLCKTRSFMMRKDSGQMKTKLY